MRIAYCTNLAEDRIVTCSAEIITALRARNHDVVFVHSLAGIFQPFDAALLRPCPPIEDLYQETTADAYAAAVEAARAIELRGVRFLNRPSHRPRSDDKLFSALCFERAGLPQPATWPLEATLLAEASWPAIVKPRGGASGRGVVLCGSLDEAIRHERELDERCVVQQFVADARCIRVIASQTAVFARYAKEMADGDFVAGISHGGERVDVPADRALDELACAMVCAVGDELAGVDILETNDGRLLALETNPSFGFDPERADIVALICDTLEDLAAGR